MHACQKQDRLEKKSFFNWFYFAINWGSCIAVTVIVYIQARAYFGTAVCLLMSCTHTYIPWPSALHPAIYG
jgi:dipeptide/tripeptide permease